MDHHRASPPQQIAYAVKKVEGQRAAAWARIFVHFGAQIASSCTLYFVPKPVLYCFLGMIVRLKRTGRIRASSAFAD
jgi:hypothetical protein